MDYNLLLYTDAVSTNIPSIYYYFDEENDQINNLVNLIKLNIEDDISDLYILVKSKKLIDPLTFVYLWILIKNGNEDDEEFYKKFIEDNIEGINKFLTLNSAPTSNLENNYNYWINNTYHNLLEFDVRVLGKLQSITEILDKVTEPIFYHDIEITESNAVFNIFDSFNNKVDPEDGIEIFNFSRTSIDIPFIKYTNQESKVFYKIYDPTFNTEKIPHEQIYSTRLITPEINTFLILIKNYDNQYRQCTLYLKNGVVEIPYKNNIEEIKNGLINTFPSLFFKQVNRDKIKGTFLIDNVKIYLHVLHYLINIEEPFVSFLFVDEKNKAFADKKGYNINYRNPGFLSESEDQTSQVVISFDDNDEQDFSFSENIKPLKVNFSKAESSDVLYEFLEIFSKLMKIYMDELNNVKSIFNEIIPYESSDSTQKKNYKKNKIFKTVNDKKINNLTEKSPSTFNIGKGDDSYSKKCSCKDQPLIIKESEIEDWKNKTYIFEGNPKQKREVLKFKVDNYNIQPGKGEGGDSKGFIYVVCPNDENPHPKITKYEKPDGTYGVFPCCKIKEHETNQEAPFNKPVKNYTYKVDFFKRIKTSKAQGKIYHKIVDILKIPGESDFIRIGIQSSKHSLIHCVLNAIEDQKYINLQNDESREKYSVNVRLDIAKKISPIVYKQEMWDFDDDTILDLIENLETELNSYLFYRGLEEYFGVNIFVFNSVVTSNKDKSDAVYSLEIPRSKFCHIRTPNKKKSVIILKHIKFNNENNINYTHCELIVSLGSSVSKETIETTGNNTLNIKINSENNLNKSYIFGSNMTNHLFSILNKLNENHVFNGLDGIKLRINPFSQLNWEDFFFNKGFTLISQKIDQYGKLTALKIKKESREYTILVPMSQPLNIPIMDSYSYQSKKKIIKIFGEPHSINKEGLWYKFLDTKEGVLILSSETLIDTSYKDTLVSSSLVEEPGTIKIVENVYEMRKVKKQITVMMQLINWLWKISIIEKGYLIDIDKWFKKYLKNTGNSNKEYVPYTKIERRLKYVRSTKEGLQYIKDWWPEYFRHDGIYLYDKLYNNVVSFFKREYKLIEGLPLDSFYNKIPSKIDGIYIYEEDFNQIKDSIVLIDENFIKKWIDLKKEGSSIYSDDKLEIIKSINIDFYDKSEPYIYKDQFTGKIYLVQNVKSGELSRALNLCMKWETDKINYGVNIEPLNEEFINNFSDDPFDNISYLIYGISKNSKLVPIQNKVVNNKRKIYQVLRYTKDSNKYAALLSIL